MCGVFGKLSFNENPRLDENGLRAMGETIRYRGPDDDGYLCDGPLSFGMRRLSIIDLNTGKQPIFDSTGNIAVILNGEIYNYIELRKSLIEQGYKFKTDTDTEVIVHLFHKKGISCIDDLRGMFAFALWDKKSKHLYLARDRLGKKPLYYSISKAGITFGSEIKAVLADTSVSRDIDYNAVDMYMGMQFIPHPYTVFKSIRKLLPGHYIVAAPNGNIENKRYWQLAFQPKYNLSENEYIYRFGNILNESTRIRLRSDVPLGLLLSGGLDSAAIAAAITDTNHKQFKTFSVGFKGVESDELPAASEIARCFSTNHHPIEIDTNVSDILPGLVNHFDEPFGDSSAVPTFLVSREARKHVKVVLNGDGGDEACAGYPRYANLPLIADMYTRYIHDSNSGSINRILRGALKPCGQSYSVLSRKFRKLLIPAHRAVFQPESFSVTERYNLYNDNMKNVLNPGSWNLYMELIETSIKQSLSAAESVLNVDINLYLPCDLLVKMDMMTMANSLEARSPFLDHKLLEYTSRIPMNMKIRGNIQKWILRRYIGNRIPEHILNMPKRGFGLPLKDWIRRDLKPMVNDLLLDSPSGLNQCFEPDKIKTWVKTAMSKNHGNEKKIWSLLIFEIWYRGLKRL